MQIYKKGYEAGEKLSNIQCFKRAHDSIQIKSMRNSVPLTFIMNSKCQIKACDADIFTG